MINHAQFNGAAAEMAADDFVLFIWMTWFTVCGICSILIGSDVYHVQVFTLALFLDIMCFARYLDAYNHNINAILNWIMYKR